MKNNKYYLGLDFGTSSLKGIYKSPAGDSFTAKISYSENTVKCWLTALKQFFESTPDNIKKNTVAMALSSQVGTYITENNTVIPWFADIGSDELKEIKSLITDDEFINHLGMKHPDIISYPLPRLLYLKKNNLRMTLQMPKEIIIKHLTGKFVTDYFSMRGLAHPQKGYAFKLLERLSLSPVLPQLLSPLDKAGTVLPEIAEKYGLSENTSVYLGCNDFFAGLLGIGVFNTNCAFDLSGTSEHFGFISEKLTDSFVSGPYFNGFCSYGGTKASGISCDFAIKNFGENIDLSLSGKSTTPIFLPYLSGERAPIFDEHARGVFFGIHGETTKEQMAYAVFEGVVFSLYDISLSLNIPTPDVLFCGAGSSKNDGMNRLRAELFGCDVKTVRENDVSALGAALIAMTGDGVYPDLRECIKENVYYLPVIKSSGDFTQILRKRFAIYRNLYKNLKPQFAEFSKIYGGQ